MTGPAELPTYQCTEHDWASSDGPCPECIRLEREHYFPTGSTS